jgi:steroid delta-isomerase-like uncharacterized protein
MKNRFALLILPVLALLFSQCAAVKNVHSAEKNKEAVRLWFEEGWNHNRNEELIPTVFHPEWNDGNPIRANQIDGHEGMKQLVQFYRKAFPDSHFKITHLFATENNVAIRYEVTATHVGDAFGIKGTGKHFSSTGIVLYEMKDGKIFRSWQELDLMGIIRQLKEE